MSLSYGLKIGSNMRGDSHLCVKFYPSTNSDKLSESDKVDAGHFAWADAADAYATLIIDWWNGGYERE